MIALVRFAAAQPDWQAEDGLDQRDDQQIEICHQLPRRLRLRFEPPISEQACIQIQAALEHQFPPLQFRYVNRGQGLVVRSPGAAIDAEDLIGVLRDALGAPWVHQVAHPPSRWDRVQDQLRQGSIRLFLALAVAGWILPILPGTPFFLVAWWLGWRPPAAQPAELDPPATE